MKTDEQPHERLDFDHLDFAQACELCATLQAAVVAVASWSEIETTDRIALLYGRAEARKADAFREYERDENAKADNAD